jgi:hypothetical protein
LIPEYFVLIERIDQELDDLENVISCAERGVLAAQNQSEEEDLFIDAVALNLHDFYTGFERIFQQIGSIVDGYIPGGANWHRDLLQKMQLEIPELRQLFFRLKRCKYRMNFFGFAMLCVTSMLFNLILFALLD